jgi:hypothetical protein
MPRRNTKHEKAWVKWRKRAFLAERQLDGLRSMFINATGMSPEQYFYVQTAKIYVESPRSSIHLTGLRAPVMEDGDATARLR